MIPTRIGAIAGLSGMGGVELDYGWSYVGEESTYLLRMPFTSYFVPFTASRESRVNFERRAQPLCD